MRFKDYLITEVEQIGNWSNVRKNIEQSIEQMKNQMRVLFDKRLANEKKIEELRRRRRNTTDPNQKARISEEIKKLDTENGRLTARGQEIYKQRKQYESRLEQEMKNKPKKDDDKFQEVKSKDGVEFKRKEEPKFASKDEKKEEGDNIKISQRYIDKLTQQAIKEKDPQKKRKIYDEIDVEQKELQRHREGLKAGDIKKDIKYKKAPTPAKTPDKPPEKQDQGTDEQLQKAKEEMNAAKSSSPGKYTEARDKYLTIKTSMEKQKLRPQIAKEHPRPTNPIQGVSLKKLNKSQMGKAVNYYTQLDDYYDKIKDQYHSTAMWQEFIERQQKVKQVLANLKKKQEKELI